MSSLNKELVLRFYRDIVGKGDFELAQALIAEDYIQHNPLLPSGRAGVIAALQYLQKIPREAPKESPIKRIIAEDNYVVVHMNVFVAGEHQVVMDIFRLANGQLVEHWDAIESVDISQVQQLMDGPQEIGDLAATQSNKQIIDTHCQVLVKAGQFDKTHRIIAEGNFVLAQSSGLKEGIPYVFYDLYCLSGGKIVRHWPVKQAIPEKMAHTNGMI
ncbi:MAG: nuclear transport factor 2 family protein [Bacteroidota bacterium]